MDAGQKSFQLQSQLRQNAENLKSTLKDLYSWEKEIKSKEQELQNNQTSGAAAKQEPEFEAPPVVRSLLQEAGSTKRSEKNAASTPTINETPQKVEPPTEKVEMPIDPNEEKRKQANAIKERGNQHVKLGEYVKAIEQYTAAIDVFPEDACFYTNRALCYLKLKKYYDCIEDCERAIEIDSLAVKAYYRRMLANEELGNDRNALKDCTTILMIEPKNKDAKISLERINETLRSNVKSITGPNFCPVRSDMCFIEAIDKPPHARSKKLLKRVPITDVVGPKDSKNQANSNIQVTDEVIDKLFNSDCGPFVEVKKEKENTTTAKTSTTKSAPSVKPTSPTCVKQSETADKTETVQTKNITVNKNETVQAKKLKESVETETEKEKPAEKVKQTKKERQMERAKQTQNAKQIEKAKQTEKAEQMENIDSNKRSTVSPKSVQPEEQKADIANATNSDKPLPAAPTSTAQFYANWKELSAAQKYQYLKSIEVGHFCKILGAGFDSDTLTDVINTLRDFYVPNKEPNLAATLLAVSKNNQVAILSLLMSTEERKVITEILNFIKESTAHASTAALIAKNFNLQ